MNTSKTLEKAPEFPSFLAFPFKLLPSQIHSKILIVFLNRLLAEQISEGDLDFLIDKRLCVKINDMGFSYYISMLNKRLVAVRPTAKNDIEIQANVYDFLQLAARQQDPDTLVFQRRLVMQGNTELGLEIKNFLDGLDLEASSSFSKIEYYLQKSLPVYRRLFS